MCLQTCALRQILAASGITSIRNYARGRSTSIIMHIGMMACCITLKCLYDPFTFLPKTAHLSMQVSKRRQLIAHFSQ